MQNVLDIFLPHIPSPYNFTTDLQTMVLSQHHRGCMLSIVFFHIFVHPILFFLLCADVLHPPSGDIIFELSPPFPIHCLIPLFRSKTGCNVHRSLPFVPRRQISTLLCAGRYVYLMKSRARARAHVSEGNPPPDGSEKGCLQPPTPHPREQPTSICIVSCLVCQFSYNRKLTSPLGTLFFVLWFSNCFRH